MKQYYLWLVLAFGAGNPLINELLERFETPKSAYEAIRSNCAAIGTVNNMLAEKTDISEAEEMLSGLFKRGIDVITYDDEKYPTRLRDLENPPCLLFAAGNTDLLTKKLVSTSGSRAATNYTLYAQDKICRELYKDYVLVSSLSGGCDSMTCLCAIKNSGGFIEVLPCGFDYEYPRDSRTLRYQLLSLGGCVITEYPPSVKPNQAAFVRRSRIIGGISGALLVFQAGIDSGALLPANYSHAAFFLPPHNVFLKDYAGAAAAVRAGARLFYDKSDIDAAFSDDFVPTNVKLERRLKPRTPKIAKNRVKKQAVKEYAFETELEKAVYSKIAARDEPVLIDDIYSGMECEISELYEILLDLEITGKILSYPGSRYGTA